MSGRQHKETEVARRVRAKGLAAGRTLAQIADEVHEICGPQFGTSRIKSHRLANGIALADVVEQVRALFDRDSKPAPGIGETLLSAYESGLKRPGPEYLHYLCQVYRVEPVSLGYEGPCICGHGHRMPDLAVNDLGVGTTAEDRTDTPPEPRELWIQPIDADPVASDRGEEDENVLRRTLLTLLAGTPAALNEDILGAVDGIRKRMDDTLVSASVSPSMIDQWEIATTGFGSQYMKVPPLRLLCDVLLEFSAVRRAGERRQPIDIQERLSRMAAQLAGLSGIVMIDLGDHRLARSFFRTGRTAADETGDRGLRAWVTARESLLPLYYGDPREALNLARRSRDLAGQTPCAASVLAPVVEARALAMLADLGRKDAVDQAKRALGRARNAFNGLRDDEQADPAFGYTERQLLFHQGDTLARLGEASEADRLLAEALEKCPSNEWLDPALIKFDRARCRLISGDVDEALEMGKQIVFDLAEDCRSDIVLQRARELAAHAQKIIKGDSRALDAYRHALLPIISNH